MFAVDPSTRPPSATVPTVSTPSSTRSTRSPGAAGSSASARSYRQSVPWNQRTDSSCASRYGSGIRPAASRSVCTEPGTSAARAPAARTASGTGPAVAATVQPSARVWCCTGAPGWRRGVAGRVGGASALADDAHAARRHRGDGPDLRSGEQVGPGRGGLAVRVGVVQQEQVRGPVADAADRLDAGLGLRGARQARLLDEPRGDPVDGVPGQRGPDVPGGPAAVDGPPG